MKLAENDRIRAREQNISRGRRICYLYHFPHDIWTANDTFYDYRTLSEKMTF